MKLTSSFVTVVLLLSVSTAALPTPRTPHAVERSFLSGIASKVGKDAASEGEAAAKSSSSGGILSHLENLGSGGLSAAFKDLLGGDDSDSTAASSAQTNSTVAARSLLSSVVGTAGKDAAKDAAGAAGKVASGGILSKAKDALISGAENLAGSAVVGSVIDHFEGDSDSSATGAQANATVAARELDERSLFSSVAGAAGKDAVKNAAGAAGKAASGGILSKAKNAIISEGENLVGSTVVGSIIDHFEGDSDSSATGAQTNATVAARELNERSLLSSVFGAAGKDAAKDAAGAAGKAASGGILSEAKSAIISEGENLVGSTVVGDVIDHFEGDDSGSATDAQANATVARMVRVRREVAW